MASNSGPFTAGSFENSVGFGGINKMLDPGGIFQPPPNPADSAMPYLDKISGMLPQYFQPYMQAGQWALPQLQQQYGQLLNNPDAVMNKVGSGFQQSPGYQFQTQQALGAANRAAAAGGMAGSPAEQQSIASTVNGLANQDYYNYLNHGLSLYSQGLQGMGSMYGMGYDASKNLGEDLAQTDLSQANLAYAGQSDVNQGRFGMLGNAMGAAGALFSIL